MAATFALPVPVENKLAALARQVRRFRWVRGLGLLTLVLAVTFLLLFGLDLWLDLSEEVLAVVLGGTVLLAVGVGVFGLLLPWLRPVDHAALAAAIERLHPELAERLTSSVRLAEGSDPHGTATFIARLLEETESQTAPLAFRNAVSFRVAHVVSGLAVAVLLLAALAALALPAQMADFSQRFLLSWFAPPALRLEVEPGTTATGTGRPFTVSVQVHRRSERIAWPNSAYLVLTDAAGRQKRLPLEQQSADSFHATVDRVEDSFSYRIEAGPVSSDTFQVTAVEPVELAEDSPLITVTPPAYVNRQFVPEETILPLASSMSALQYSKIHCRFRLTRPAVQASVVVALVSLAAPAEGTSGPGPSWQFRLSLTADAREGTLSLPMLAPGRYTLAVHLEAEHGVATDRDLPELTIRADQPPVFVGMPHFLHNPFSDDVTGSAGPVVTESERLAMLKSPADTSVGMRVTPGDSLPVSLTAADPEGVDQVVIEYCLNGNAPLPAVLRQADGRRLIPVDQRWQLHGLVKDGDLVFCRLKVTDRRKVPAQVFRDATGRPTPVTDLTPQAIYYPAPSPGQPRWFLLRVDQKARPVEEGEILTQQESVNQTIGAVKKKIIQAREKVQQLEQTSRHQKDLQDSQADDLGKLEKANQDIQADLQALARKTAKVPELQQVGAKAQQLAQTEMARSGKALQTARQKRAEQLIRQQQLFLADEQWSKALEQLEGLGKFNQERARARREALKLKQLAQREQELGQQVGQMEKLAKDDPALQAALAKLQAEQQKVAGDLNKLAKSSPAVQQALNQAQASQAKDLARQAQAMAKTQEGLAQQAAKSLKKQLTDVLEEFAKQQQLIADHAGLLAQQTTKEVSARQIGPMQLYPARAAVQSLRQGQIMHALGQQAFTARELDRLGDQLEDSLDLTASPRDYVLRLAARQKRLEDYLVSEAKQLSGKTSAEIKKVLQDVQQGQAAIEHALQETVRPLVPESARSVHKEAAEAAAKCVKLLVHDAYLAREEMEQSRHALEALAALLPGGAQDPASLSGKKGPPAAGKPYNTRRSVDDLHKLAQTQRDLRQKIQDLLGQSSPPANKGNALEQVAKKQEKFEKQADELTKKLEELAQSPNGSAEGKKAAKEASKDSQRAKEAMKESQKQGKQGNAAGAKESAEEAAQMMKSAAQKAEQASQQMGGQQSQEDNPGSKQAQQKASQALQQGQKQANQAQGQLKPGQLPGARQAMQQASQSLGQAAEHMKSQMQRAKTSVERPGAVSGGVPIALPDLKKYGPGLEKYNGKSWGQLPGELKTRILMDARAQYGPEYAEIIQRYFEGIADTQSDEN